MTGIAASILNETEGYIGISVRYRNYHAGLDGVPGISDDQISSA